jgi:serine/threonine protein kinase
MSQNIDDQKLFDLLDGRLSEAEERELEQWIMSDPSARTRWEILTGSAEWPIGSAPQPEAPVSEHLSVVMERLRFHPPESLSAPSRTLTAVSDEDNLQQLRQELAGFQVLREIGRGGMGIVYEGLDEALQRRVAIKLLKPIQSDDGSAQQRLLGEAQAIAALHHENILSIYGVQFLSGKPVLIEQYVDGESLQKRIEREGALPISDCISIALQIAKGLAAAHACDIVHRDLKPDNILLDGKSQVAKIADFGLAKRGSSSKLTGERFIAGTPSYMSPEQTETATIDARSDLFSLGAIMYVMVTGVVPFDHPDPFVVFDMLRRKQVDPAIALRPETPAWLSCLIDQLLSKNPDDRPSQAAEVVRSLESQQYRSRKGTVRHGARIAIGVGLLCMFGLLAFPFLRRQTIAVSVPDIQQHTRVESVVASVPKRGVWIDGRETNFLSLSDAIQEAVDGDTLYIDRDLSDSGIQVQGKKISIVAWAGTQPTIRYAEQPNRTTSYLLRTDSDLMLRGLRFEWKPLQAIQLFEEGQLSNMISAGYDTELVVDDCDFHSTQLGTVLGFAGSARITNSAFSSELFALGCLLHGGSIEVVDCTFRCRSGIAILYPPTNRMVPIEAQLSVQRSKFEGLSVIDLILIRKPLIGFRAEWKECEFDTQHTLVLSRSGGRAPELETFSEIQEWAHRLIRWQETKCRHSNMSEFLAGRNLRQPNKTISEFEALEAWQSFWRSSPGGESYVMDPSRE